MTQPQQDFEDRLRRVLENAARELDVGPATWRGPSESPRRRPRRAKLRTLGAAVAIAVPVAIAVFALVALRQGPTHASTAERGGPPAPQGPLLPAHPTSAQLRAIGLLVQAMADTRRADAACAPIAHPIVESGAPSAALLSALAVLRRPARPGDEPPRGELFAATGSAANRAYARLVARAGGAKYYIVPTMSAGGPGPLPSRCYAEQRQTLDRQLARVPRDLRAPTLALEPRYLARLKLLSRPQQEICMIELDGRARGGECTGVSAVAAQQFMGFGPDRVYGIVPDGVATVTLYYPGRIVTTSVTNNVFVVRARFPHNGPPNRVVWRGPLGEVLRPDAATYTGPSSGFSSGQARSGSAARPPVTGTSSGSSSSSSHP